MAANNLANGVEDVDEAGYTSLMRAVLKGQLDEPLPQEYQDNINAINKKTKGTALTIAASRGWHEIVKLLVGYRARPDLGEPPALFAAAVKGHVHVVEYLAMTNGPATGETIRQLINRVRQESGSYLEPNNILVLLMYSYLARDILLVDRLVRDSPKALQTNERRLLTTSPTSESHNSAVQSWLSINPNQRRQLDVNSRFPDSGATILGMAVEYNLYEIIKLLIKKGADLELKNNKGNTPLISAAMYNKKSLVELLLMHGANLENKTNLKDSALGIACRFNSTETIEFLLKCGASTEYKNGENRTPLQTAIAYDREGAVDLIRKHKDCIRKSKLNAMTTLIEAAKENDTIKGEMLLQNGVQVNKAIPKTGETALTIAAAHGHLEFVKMLLKCKYTQVDKMTKKGRTAIWLACDAGYLHVAKLLHQHKADLECKDNENVTCLMAALHNGHISVVCWIVKLVQCIPSATDLQNHVKGITNDTFRCAVESIDRCLYHISLARDRQELIAKEEMEKLLNELELEENQSKEKRKVAQTKKGRQKKQKQAMKQLKLVSDKPPNSNTKLVINEDCHVNGTQTETVPKNIADTVIQFTLNNPALKNENSSVLEGQVKDEGKPTPNNALSKVPIEDDCLSEEDRYLFLKKPDTPFIPVTRSRRKGHNIDEAKSGAKHTHIVKCNSKKIDWSPLERGQPVIPSANQSNQLSSSEVYRPSLRKNMLERNSGINPDANAIQIGVVKSVPSLSEKKNGAQPCAAQIKPPLSPNFKAKNLEESTPICSEVNRCQPIANHLIEPLHSQVDIQHCVSTFFPDFSFVPDTFQRFWEDRQIFSALGNSLGHIRNTIGSLPAVEDHPPKPLTFKQSTTRFNMSTNTGQHFHPPDIFPWVTGDVEEWNPNFDQL